MDTTPFKGEDAMLSDHSFLYVPNSCLNQSCRFHVDFHGCWESNVLWNDTFARQVGYMEHAAASNIIVLFPSTNDTDFSYCWRSSVQDDIKHPQIKAIANLIEAIFGRDLLHEGVERT